MRLCLCRTVRAAALAATLLVIASDAGAQTVEQLFDDSQVTDVHLQLSQRDWDTMRRVIRRLSAATRRSCSVLR